MKFCQRHTSLTYLLNQNIFLHNCVEKRDIFILANELYSYLSMYDIVTFYHFHYPTLSLILPESNLA